MSMIKCKECGSQISSKANQCPHCGSPNKRTSVATWLVGGTMLMLMVPACYTMLTPSYEPPPQPAEAVVDNTPKITVRSSATDVTITNTGTADWPVVELYLNGDPPDGWKLRATAPAVGQSHTYLFGSFTTKDGRRFNPLSHQAQNLWVGGGGKDFALYHLRSQ